MSIKSIIRKFGYISEKSLIDAAVTLYERNDTANAHDYKDFYFRCGVSNATGYICRKFGISVPDIIKKGKQNESD